MLRFFSKIRYQLAAENRAAKYIRYAIGEIMLVVIGILIALQVNNWNETKKLEKAERSMLVNLGSEFEINYAKLLNIRSNNNRIYACTNQLKNLIGRNTAEIEKYNIDSLLYISILIADFQPDQFVLSQLKSTDKLQIINSEKLKKYLYEWENAMNAKTEAFSMWHTYFMNSLIPFLDENASIRNMDSYGKYQWSSPTPLKYNSTEIFSMIQFDNRLENHMWCLNEFSTAIETLIGIAEKVSKEIESEKLKN
jgi:hypothetical protein